MGSISPTAGFGAITAPSARPAPTAPRRTESLAYILDFSPLAYSSPSPYDRSDGGIVQLGPRPELLAELDTARRAQQQALEDEVQAKEDERSGKTIKPFTLKEFLEKIDEKFDLYSAKRLEARNPLALTNEQRALLREDRLGPLWKNRFRWRF